MGEVEAACTNKETPVDPEEQGGEKLLSYLDNYRKLIS